MNNLKIAIVGLGYVGLPLAVEFGKKHKTLGFDINTLRVDELNEGIDSTLEVTSEELKSSNNLSYSSNARDLSSANFYVVTVPTPIDKHKQPDLTPLIKASEMLGSVISSGDIIVYESTVYPGATEDECIPVVERISGFKLNKDFYAGYSPERINPGDKLHKVSNILKVTSGSTEKIADYIDDVYRTIITAGTYKASNIKVAEASKVIENVQRDVNIALVNELHQIFSKLDIDTNEVIDAASTKWNFMKLKPGLVGGHCIGVDPYYLLHKSQTSGYVPDLLRKAREINDSMPSFIAQDFLKSLVLRKINPIKSKVALLGFTFKENCPDIRNTKAFDLHNELKDLGMDVVVVDPWADKDEVQRHYNITLLELSELAEVDACLLTVGHKELIEYCNNLKEKTFVYDFKGVLK